VSVETPLAKLEELARLRQRMTAFDQLIATHAPARVRPWHSLARPNQIPPPGDWSIALFLAGRGFGKSRLAAEWIAEQAATNPGTEWAIVAPTWRDCKKNCIEAVVNAMLPGELESMNSSDLLIRFTNGSKVWGYSSDGFERLRGSNLAGSWCDEMAVYAAPDELFSEALMPALRIGESPRLVITTTPRPIPFLRGLVARDDGSVVVIKGSTWDNAANLSKTALAELRTRYEGTRTGRQELLGELLSEVAGAFWSLKMIEDTRVKEAPTMARIVVAMDPATTSGEKSDQTGIIVAGRGMDGHLYVLQDLSMKGSPHACMAAVVKAYHNWQADCIVAETNNGGDYLENVLRQVDANVAYRTVRATRGKAVRAEPVSALWEQGRAHIVGCLPELEDQMAACTPPDANGKDRKSKDPDDRVDALVYAATELQIGASAMLYLAAISKMCPKCDKPNVKRAMACKGCGTSLPDADAA
jgi:phage terminase large subunit-like protein